MKTLRGVLVLCLHIGVDPPDVAKPNPCARLHSWLNPNPETPTKSLHAIGTALQAQYERWQPKARCKPSLDPTVTELKRVCDALRRAAKEERVLFHYNGHGVPRPTANGEIWVFNENYSKYIPLNLLDLNEVLGSPTLYVFDCHSAGTILYHFEKMIEQSERDWQNQRRHQHSGTATFPPHRNSVFLAACTDGEFLPMVPHVPADLFTACLTTPIKTALRWFSHRTIIPNVTEVMIDRIPGDPLDRSTPLGELELIFGSIADAIAWNVLPLETFRKLYRQDVMLGSLMRNFILAQRILKSFGCTPVSYPHLPETHNHPFWNSFDVAIENIFSQLPTLIEAEDARNQGIRSVESDPGLSPFSPCPLTQETMPCHAVPASHPPRQPQPGGQPHRDNEQKRFAFPHSYRPFTFFPDQMKSLSIWLNDGPGHRDVPEQLPIILHILSIPQWRPQAMQLFSRYLQTGPAAVDMSLAVGIYPYLLGLLKFQCPEIRNDLVFIWSKLLAFDSSDRVELVEQQMDGFFVSFLQLRSAPEVDPNPVYLACAMFVLSVVARRHADRCLSIGTMGVCFDRLSHSDPFVRRWACLCLTEIYERASPPAQVHALDQPSLLASLSHCAVEDMAPDVRASAVSTLSMIMNEVLRKSSSTNTMLHVPTANVRPTHIPGGNIGGTSSLANLPNTLTHLEMNAFRPPFPMGIITGKHFMPHDGVEIDNRVLDACSTLPFSEDERDALMKIGVIIAKIARVESSVLVRREVAIAIARTVLLREKRFLRAALITDVYGVDRVSPDFRNGEDAECELVYRSLWISLSELAFDPHPVNAVIARSSYDKICDTLMELKVMYKCVTPYQKSTGTEVGNIYSKEGSSLGTLTALSSKTTESSDVSIHNPMPPHQGGGGLRQERSPSHQPGSPDLMKGGHPSEEYEPSSQESAVSSRKSVPPSGFVGADGLLERFRQGMRKPEPLPSQPHVMPGRIHVRSSSGSFDLNISPHLSKNTGNTCIRRDEFCPTLRQGFGTIGPDLSEVLGPDATQREVVEQEQERVQEAHLHDGQPRSLPHMHMKLAKGVGNLVKTFSQQFNLGRLGGAPSSGSPQSPMGTSVPQVEKKFKEEIEVKAISPPRPPRRSFSYQVLNSATSLSPNIETAMDDQSQPIASSMRPPPGPSSSPSVEDANRKDDGVAPVSNQLQQSIVGKAALSLYEWSSDYISRAELKAPTLDYANEDIGIPRYATLWNKINRTSRSMPIADSLRAFALLGRGDDVIGFEAVENDTGFNTLGDDDFSTASELSLYIMGAGGGGVVSMTFLPRDTGMGDDQLIATGDTTGSVGVYDARSGKCQGAFGIPLSHDVYETRVSSIICLNPQSGDGENKCDIGFSNSRSALILGAAYDGRVAVFKSDFAGPKYRIMSAFQASGYGDRNGNGNRVGSNMKRWGGDLSGVRGNCPASRRSTRECGNGLVVAFNTSSSYLAAGGCDGPVVRVWDLAAERCVWEGASVGHGGIPTSLTMSKSEGNEQIFVVGSSNGSVNVVDMREGSGVANGGRHVHEIGMHDDPIKSIGTCPPEERVGRMEMVLSADSGGKIVFWDPRWNGLNSSGSERNDHVELSRIGAHKSNLTAMCVHRTGKYIASGSKQGVKIFDANRKIIKMISQSGSVADGRMEGHRDDVRYEPTQGNRLCDVTCLAFQHESALLAVGCMDSSVMIYGRHRDLFPGIQS